MSYPKWVYNAAGGVIVQDKAEHDALEGDWYESPADVPAPGAEAPVAESVARAELVAAAEAKGLTVGKRWSDKRLAAEIEKA